ncbi:MAG: cell division protein FtsK, partial [Rickettsiales bacterium]|jgi:S-DNA-T family DNA segregation ATPase FtsK/SpoIIIE|nr:cell division protein FtsK [Rickettsiales bacterium]
MIDPKRLELSAYDGIPHLLMPVVTDSKKAVMSMKWIVNEMENRYRIMSSLGVRNVYGYNEKIRQAIRENTPIESRMLMGYDEYGEPVYSRNELEAKQLPFIVVIVDEMADLMITAGKEIEALIQRVAQMARAAGIHIIMATQRPSVDVLTGVIKANFPSRVSFLVSSRIDSKVILGEQGAEQLLGMGDMLHMQNGSKISRAHGPFVSDNEVEKVVEFITKQGFRPEYVKMARDSDGSSNGENDDGGNMDIDIMGHKDDESIYQQAVDIIKKDRKVSISYLQRQLRIGYNKAATLVERMEKEGIISPVNAIGKRDVLK